MEDFRIYQKDVKNVPEEEKIAIYKTKKILFLNRSIWDNEWGMVERQMDFLKQKGKVRL